MNTRRTNKTMLTVRLLLLLTVIFFAELLVNSIAGHIYAAWKIPELSFAEAVLLLTILVIPTFLLVLRPMSREIEKRVRAEEEFRRIFESSPFTILTVVDEQGTIIRANNRVKEVFGYEPGELTGQKVELLLPERLKATHLEHRHKYMLAPEERRLGVGRDLVGRRKDGTEVPVEIALTPMKRNGKTVILTTLTDISVRKKAENEYKESEEKFRAMIETAQEGVWLLDTKSRGVFVNQRMREMLGYAEDEILGHSPLEFVHDDDKVIMRKQLEARRKDVKGRYDIRLRQKNGNSVFTTFSGTPYLDRENRVAGAFAMVTDITKSKEAEAKRDEALKAREELVTVVSHEIKNPLTTITTSLHIARRSLPAFAGKERVDKLLDNIQAAVQRTNNITSDLLDVTKIDFGRLVIKYSLVDIPNLVTEVVESYKSLAVQKSIKLESKIFSEVNTIACDRDRIVQVLSNLVANAIKFTGENGSVRVEVEQSHDQIHFKVIDTGCGIPAEQIQHVFERFWQAKHKQYVGVGLGLYIAESIVKAHEGKIGVESNEGEGSTFSFSLPVAQAKAASKAA